MTTVPSPRLIRLARGPFGIVVAEPGWRSVCLAITPPKDSATALAKVRTLVTAPFNDLTRTKWLTFPMTGRAGLFEIRHNGVRLYGCRSTTIDTRAVFVMLTSEQKAGKSKANPAVLDAAEALLKTLALDLKASATQYAAELKREGEKR